MNSRLKERLDAGQAAVGAQLRFGSPAIAEMFGHAGFDWLVIDSEHAPQTPEGIQAQLQAIGNTPATPVVRLPRVDEEQIRLYLDMGALGIMAAFVETPQDAEFGALACRYPPRGIRSFGPHRAGGFGRWTAEYLEEIDDLVSFIPIIESAPAVDEIESILAVDGVDFPVIGPVDLSFGLDTPFEFESEVFQEAQAKVAAAAAAAGKPAGLGIYRPAFEPASLEKAMEDGFQALLVGGDEPFLATACEMMAGVRRELDL